MPGLSGSGDGNWKDRNLSNEAYARTTLCPVAPVQKKNPGRRFYRSHEFLTF